MKILKLIKRKVDCSKRENICQKIVHGKSSQSLLKQFMEIKPSYINAALYEQFFCSVAFVMEM